jgi:hypothetical protein
MSAESAQAEKMRSPPSPYGANLTIADYTSRCFRRADLYPDASEAPDNGGWLSGARTDGQFAASGLVAALLEVGTMRAFGKCFRTSVDRPLPDPCRPPPPYAGLRAGSSCSPAPSGCGRASRRTAYGSAECGGMPRRRVKKCSSMPGMRGHSRLSRSPVCWRRYAPSKRSRVALERWLAAGLSGSG